MSGTIVPIIAAISAATASTSGIVAARKRQAEEEQMAQYHSDDLDGWEFKIVRSALGRFSSRTYIEKVCQEEAQAGWEMVEKFDDQRIRFKRRLEKRSLDPHLDIDPYRTTVSAGSKPTVMIAVGIALTLVGVAALLFTMYSR